MNKTEKYTDKEWEELASLLSDEKSEKSELLDRFLANDAGNIGNRWKELKYAGTEREINVDKAWNNIYSKLNDNGFRNSVISANRWFIRGAFLRVAAAALIILCLGSTAVYLNKLGTFSKKITSVTGNGQKNLLVALSDGSKVFLNRNSEFSYRKNFGIRGRNVRLRGEAFFLIAADVSKPFIIDAGNASVKVVGTSFNVITENSDSAVEVFVKTGTVQVSNNSGSETIQLDPGFVGTIDSEKSAKALNRNPNYLSWNTGLLIYNGQKLDVVFNDLKRAYNMDIVADDPSILENPWTSPIDNKSEETIIQLICLSFNLSYTKVGTVYHLSKK
jgi:transmembrane sensor